MTRIAVTYDNGQVFQHFGRTEEFKIYEVENGQIISSEVMGSNGSGHGALAGLLSENAVDVLICGGIGGGAQAALMDAGIQLFAGASGSTDEAVASFLRGELVNAGVTCNHHDHEEGHSCGDHGCKDHGCGSHCGGGCHAAPEVLYEGKNAGKTVKTHYTGTFNDGTVFDSSLEREPLEFVCGVGMMIPGFDKAVVNMEVGEKVKIHLMPEEAYGMPDPEAIFEMKIKEVPGTENLEVGQQVYLESAMGYPIPVTVAAKDEENITLDANHEMAGKELNFEIELIEVCEMC